MSEEIVLPELGDGIEAGDVVNILVSIGDKVTKDSVTMINSHNGAWYLYGARKLHNYDITERNEKACMCGAPAASGAGTSP